MTYAGNQTHGNNTVVTSQHNIHVYSTSEVKVEIGVINTGRFIFFFSYKMYHGLRATNPWLRFKP